MQVSRMLPSLPRILPCIQETYSRISQVNNSYGQLKGQFNVGHGRLHVDQRSVTQMVYFLAPAGRLHTRRSP